MNEKAIIVAAVTFGILAFYAVGQAALAATRVAGATRDAVLDPITNPIGRAIVRIRSGPGAQLTPEAEERLRLAREQGLLP